MAAGEEEEAGRGRSTSSSPGATGPTPAAAAAAATMPAPPSSSSTPASTARARATATRRAMPSDQGMLFDFHSDQDVSFWMQNTYIPLDMIFIKGDGRIANIVEKARKYAVKHLTISQIYKTTTFSVNKRRFPGKTHRLKRENGGNSTIRLRNVAYPD